MLTLGDDDDDVVVVVVVVDVDVDIDETDDIFPKTFQPAMASSQPQEVRSRQPWHSQFVGPRKGTQSQ